MKKALLVVGTLALMLVSGAAAGLLTIGTLMNLGLKWYGNYEYYGLYQPTRLLLYAITLIAFLTPAVIVWHLSRRQPPWQISIREIFVGVTLLALVLAIYAWSC